MKVSINSGGDLPVSLVMKDVILHGIAFGE